MAIHNTFHAHSQSSRPAMPQVFLTKSPLHVVYNKQDPPRQAESPSSIVRMFVCALFPWLLVDKRRLVKVDHACCVCGTRHAAATERPQQPLEDAGLAECLAAAAIATAATVGVALVLLLLLACACWQHQAQQQRQGVECYAHGVWQGDEVVVFLRLQHKKTHGGGQRAYGCQQLLLKLLAADVLAWAHSATCTMLRSISFLLTPLLTMPYTNHSIALMRFVRDRGQRIELLSRSLTICTSELRGAK